MSAHPEGPHPSAVPHPTKWGVPPPMDIHLFQSEDVHAAHYCELCEAWCWFPGLKQFFFCMGLCPRSPWPPACPLWVPFGKQATDRPTDRSEPRRDVPSNMAQRLCRICGRKRLRIPCVGGCGRVVRACHAFPPGALLADVLPFRCEPCRERQRLERLAAPGGA